MGSCTSCCQSLSDKDRRDLLAAITVQQNVDNMKVILDKYPGINVNNIYLDQSEGRNPLHIACYYGLDSIVDCLLTRYQMDVNSRTKPPSYVAPLHQKYTPLIQIIQHHPRIGKRKAAELMRRLIFTYGCDVNVTDGRDSALHWCVKLEYTEGVRAILASGKANVNIKPGYTENTPLDEALLQGNSEIASLLNAHA